MRKIFILISHLFLLSFSIYGHSDPFDVSKFLNDFFNESKNVDRLKYEIYNVMPSKGSMVLKFHVSLGSKLDLCSSGSADELKIVRLCPENKENFKDKVWEEYKEEILAKCQARYSKVKVEYAKDGSISAIIDTMNIYSPIRFYTSVIQESEIIPLSHDKKDQLIKRMNYITRYHFVELDVKVRDAGFGEPIKEEKLPIAILKKGSGCFFDKLETGDTRLQIIYSEPKTIVDFEYREFSCGTSDNSDKLEKLDRLEKLNKFKTAYFLYKISKLSNKFKELSSYKFDILCDSDSDSDSDSDIDSFDPYTLRKCFNVYNLESSESSESPRSLDIPPLD